MPTDAFARGDSLVEIANWMSTFVLPSIATTMGPVWKVWAWTTNANAKLVTRADIAKSNWIHVRHRLVNMVADV